MIYSPLLRFAFMLALLTVVLRPIIAAPKLVTVDPNYYAYDAKAPFPVQTQPFETIGAVRVLRVTFPSPVITPYPVNNTVTGFLFLPASPGPHPVMLVEHEWLPTTLDTEFQMSA